MSNIKNGTPRSDVELNFKTVLLVVIFLLEQFLLPKFGLFHFKAL